jgi:site-specific recombinase XerC
VGELDGPKIEAALAKLRATGRGKRTSNQYLKAVKQFCRWLVRTKRLAEDPVADIQALNAETDPRHRRRALLAEELTLSRSGDDVHALGVDRLPQR